MFVIVALRQPYFVTIPIGVTKGDTTINRQGRVLHSHYLTTCQGSIFSDFDVSMFALKM